VYWMGNPLAQYGTAAEYSVVPVENADFVQHTDVFSAAALPLVVNTAWQVGSNLVQDYGRADFEVQTHFHRPFTQALEKSMPLAGKHVLVHAGAGMCMINKNHLGSKQRILRIFSL